MTSFERRLKGMNKRHGVGATSSIATQSETTSSLAWAAAARLLHLPQAGPDATISLTVDLRDGERTILEVVWDLNGEASVRTVPARLA